MTKRMTKHITTTDCCEICWEKFLTDQEIEDEVLEAGRESDHT